jgi:hypothetical protein
MCAAYSQTELLLALPEGRAVAALYGTYAKDHSIDPRGAFAALKAWEGESIDKPLYQAADRTTVVDFDDLVPHYHFRAYETGTIFPEADYFGLLSQLDRARGGELPLLTTTEFWEWSVRQHYGVDGSVSFNLHDFDDCPTPDDLEL